MVSNPTLPVLLFLTAALAVAPLPVQTRPGHVQPSATASPMSPPMITAETGIVLYDGRGQILYAKGPYKRVAPASLTKMVTAMVALDRGHLGDLVTVDVDSEKLVADTASSVVGLMPGDELTLEQLMYALLLPSGN